MSTFVRKIRSIWRRRNVRESEQLQREQADKYANDQARRLRREY